MQTRHWRGMIRGFSRLAPLLLSAFFSFAVYAQVSGGTISGVVTDPSGAVISQAQISVSNTAAGVNRDVTTDRVGFYTVPNLLPGTYDVAVTAPGFATVVQPSIIVTVGAEQVLDIAMQVGQRTEKIEVTVPAPEVQLSTSSLGAVEESTTIQELPLNGRSWSDLATLQPGVEAIQTQKNFSVGAARGNRGFGAQIAVSGGRPQQNNYRLDGVSLNDYANGAPGSVLGGNLGVDAIQEFSVLTSNYSAKYGKTSGGVVNAITRSGTNSIHGSVYEFLRNSALDAANFFENAGGIPKAAFKRNQFGGAIGGPIIKNRTFFFADYEGIRQSKGIANPLHVPSVNARNGVLTSGPIPGGVDSRVQQYFAFYPTPDPSCITDVCLFTFSGQQVVNENFVTTRIDHKFSEKDGIAGTYLYDKTPYNSPDAFGNVALNTLSSRQIVAVEETHSFTPTFVNALRFGYNHENVDNDASVKAINPAAGDVALGAFSGRNASFVNVNGLSALPGGVGGLPTYLYRWNSFQAYDDAFLTRGTHTIKFGAAVERMLLQVTALTDPNGIWFFDGVQNFLTNQPTKYQGGIASSLTPRDIRQTLFGAYLQDDWRWKPNFTLNLGLRYEMATIPTEIHGKLSNLRDITSGTPHIGEPFFASNPTTKNFEPRIGFAWDPFRNGRMAIRGGVGLFDVQPLPYEFILLVTQSTPFFQYTVLKNTAATPISFFSGLPSTFPSNKLRATYTDPNPKRNYVTQWNLNVQYQLTSSLAAMAAYVGSRGVHQPFRVDEANLAIPTKTSAGYVWPFDPTGDPTDPTSNYGAPLDPINTHFGSIRGMFYQGRSYFNVLELQLAKRMSHGFQMQGTYTWGKSTDTRSATLAGDEVGNSISSLDWFDMKLTRGLSDYNVGRTLVINGTWEVPAAKSFSGPARWSTAGWEIGTIFTASDGVPFTPTWGTGGDPSNSNSSDDFAYPNRLGGSGCNALTNPGNPNTYVKTQCFGVPTAPDLAFWNANCDRRPPSLGVYIQDPIKDFQTLGLPPLACFNLRGNAGRNSLIGPGIMSLDFSIFKNNHIRRISENFNVQFRAEMFNILNHANFAPPGPGDGNTDIFKADGTSLAGSTAGALVRTTIPERQIQFAIKIIF